jgi:hypothetical protein
MAVGGNTVVFAEKYVYTSKTVILSRSEGSLLLEAEILRCGSG